MKKKFSLKVMYGDADRYETVTHITEDRDEIEFLTYFLEKYDANLFLLYDRPELAGYGDLECDLDELVDVVNHMLKLSDPINKKYEVDTPNLYVRTGESDDVKAEKLNALFSDIMEGIIFEHFNWDLYDSGMDYNGEPYEYHIEDITGCEVMKKCDVIQLVKEKLGIDIVIED